MSARSIHGRTGFARRMIGRMRSLWRDVRGVALIEFAYVLPVMLTLGLFGVEAANMAITRMRVSQIALSLADNAARLGQTDNSGVTPTVSQADLDAVLDGIMREGDGIGLAKNGRVIISSLEYDDYSGKQYIHWQRCRGDLTSKQSAYGDDGSHNGLSGTPLTGMGSGTTKITAQSGSAVMFVEIYYDYQSLFTNMFVKNMSFHQEAAMLIRDDRNLTPGLVGTNTESKCS